MAWAGAQKTTTKKPWTECERYRLRKDLTKRTLCRADHRDRCVCLGRKSVFERQEEAKVSVVESITKTRHHQRQWLLGQLKEIIIDSIAQPIVLSNHPI